MVLPMAPGHGPWSTRRDGLQPPAINSYLGRAERWRLLWKRTGAETVLRRSDGSSGGGATRRPPRQATCEANLRPSPRAVALVQEGNHPAAGMLSRRCSSHRTGARYSFSGDGPCGSSPSGIGSRRPDGRSASRQDPGGLLARRPHAGRRRLYSAGVVNSGGRFPESVRPGEGR
jgi:hypothetical protein